MPFRRAKNIELRDTKNNNPSHRFHQLNEANVFLIRPKNVVLFHTQQLLQYVQFFCNYVPTQPGHVSFRAAVNVKFIVIPTL